MNTVDIKKSRCMKCDYWNNNIPITKKKSPCGANTEIDCEIATRTHRLKQRIKYLRGEIDPIWMCGKDGCHVETWED